MNCSDPNCGHTIPDGSKFCPFCGHEVKLIGAEFLEVSNTDINFPASGGTHTLTVNSYPDWTMWTKLKDWGHSSRNGNQLTICVNANTTSNNRSDWFSIQAGAKKVSIKIAQEGSTNVDPTPIPDNKHTIVAIVIGVAILALAIAIPYIGIPVGTIVFILCRNKWK